nr:RecName: Full=Toxin Bcg III 25.52; Short=Toxin Bcg 25.52 [Bunodosoma cangicum]
GVPCSCRGKSGTYWSAGKCPGEHYTTYCNNLIG